MEALRELGCSPQTLAAPRLIGTGQPEGRVPAPMSSRVPHGRPGAQVPARNSQGFCKSLSCSLAKGVPSSAPRACWGSAFPSGSICAMFPLELNLKGLSCHSGFGPGHSLGLLPCWGLHVLLLSGLSPDVTICCVGLAALLVGSVLPGICHLSIWAEIQVSLVASGTPL